jgi:two-component system response regulator AtoC
MILEALVGAGWVQTRAASALGISERMLRYKMKKLGISKEGAH